MRSRAIPRAFALALAFMTQASLRAQGTGPAAVSSGRVYAMPSTYEALERDDHATAWAGIEAALDACAPTTDHPDRCLDLLFTATAVTSLLGRYQDSDTYARRALRLALDSLGEAHIDTARAYANLGTNLRECGPPVESESYFRRALTTFLRVLGSDDAGTARVYYGLGRSLHQQGRYREAEAAYRASLDIYLRTVGEERVDTADAYINLGTSLLPQREPGAGLRYIERGLAIVERLGARRYVSQAHFSLSVAHQFLGDWEAAESWARTALRTALEVFGEHSQATLQAYWNLGGLLEQRGRHEDAEPYFRLALSGFRRLRGERSFGTALAYAGVARTRARQGDAMTAERYFRRALAILRLVHGDGHPSTARAHQDLGALLVDVGPGTEAETHLGWALAITLRMEDREHAAFAAFNLGRARWRTGGAEAAEPLLRRALALFDEGPPTESLIIDRRIGLAAAWHALGRHPLETYALFDAAIGGVVARVQAAPIHDRSNSGLAYYRPYLVDQVAAGWSAAHPPASPTVR